MEARARRWGRMVGVRRLQRRLPPSLLMSVINLPEIHTLTLSTVTIPTFLSTPTRMASSPDNCELKPEPVKMMGSRNEHE